MIASYSCCFLAAFSPSEPTKPLAKAINFLANSCCFSVLKSLSTPDKTAAATNLFNVSLILSCQLENVLC